jgi:hypothetical protein
MHQARQWLDLAGTIWLGAFVLYYVAATLTAIFTNKRASDPHPWVAPFYFLWILPFFLALGALAAISWIWGKLFKSEDK